MGETLESFHEQNPSELLNVLNQEIWLLNEVTEGRQSIPEAASLPEYAEGYAPLKEKHVVIVDDMTTDILRFLPHLTVATNGKARCVLAQNESVAELVTMICDYNPDIVLMDGFMGSKAYGPNVTKELLKKRKNVTVFGFSSDPSQTGWDFHKAGAKDIVIKDFKSEPQDVVLKVAQAVKKLSVSS